MKDLIERLEKATGPDRRIDEAIAFATGWTLNPVHRVLQWDLPGGGLSRATPLNFTASLDAALTLVPEGYAINSLAIWHGCPSSVTILGTARRPFGKYRRISFCHTAADGKWTAEAATPALAICAAALKARDAVERDLTKMEAGR